MKLNRLRELREDWDLSQQALAGMLGTSQQNIYKYENGVTEPNIQMLKSLADLFHVSVDFLVEHETDGFEGILVPMEDDDISSDERVDAGDSENEDDINPADAGSDSSSYRVFKQSAGDAGIATDARIADDTGTSASPRVRRLSSDLTHLVILFEKCRPEIRKNLLSIISELAKGSDTV